ncbi:hypothetical protein G4B88_004334 [Cannabis sativa]|uniref:Multi antimicrobial extrusion protein n=1 Tax=Cannabis sativa TaxID=3483 RepID=A0A7J6E9X4_CANSA|nr:hypothetical protein G4B88_004334 [Cannabis sativa]
MEEKREISMEKGLLEKEEKEIISVMMVGHHGKLALSSTAIAISFSAVSGFSLILGMSSALETLCGQAYGAKQYRKLGILTNTGILTLILVSIPLSLILSTIITLYTIPDGFGAATSTRVSNELGAGKPKAARFVVRVVLCLVVIEAVIVSSSLFLGRKTFGYVFSNEKEVVDYVTSMAPLVLLEDVDGKTWGPLSTLAKLARERVFKKRSLEDNVLSEHDNSNLY